MKTILFLNHRAKACGVYQYGLNIGRALEKSTRYKFVYLECSSESEFYQLVATHDPAGIIYNFYPNNIPWCHPASTVTRYLHIKHFAIWQEPHLPPFPGLYKIHHDPTMLEAEDTFNTPRLLLPYENNHPLPEITTIGSFGFAFGGKGFDRLMDKIQEAFDEAIVRVHMTFAQFGDSAGDHARATAQMMQQKLYKPGIRLEISHEWKSTSELLDWLGQHSLNAFMYDEFPGRGISSPPDFALASKRPLAITKSYMFKHLRDIQPSICVEDRSLKEIMESGTAPIEHLWEAWSETKLIEKYERIMDIVIT
jgi:hypothetical protein